MFFALVDILEKKKIKYGKLLKIQETIKKIRKII